jgi:hypothetical protein
VARDRIYRHHRCRRFHEHSFRRDLLTNIVSVLRVVIVQTAH